MAYGEFPSIGERKTSNGKNGKPAMACERPAMDELLSLKLNNERTESQQWHSKC